VVNCASAKDFLFLTEQSVCTEINDSQVGAVRADHDRAERHFTTVGSTSAVT